MSRGAIVDDTMVSKPLHIPQYPNVLLNFGMVTKCSNERSKNSVLVSIETYILHRRMCINFGKHEKFHCQFLSNFQVFCPLEHLHEISLMHGTGQPHLSLQSTPTSCPIVQELSFNSN